MYIQLNFYNPVANPAGMPAGIGSLIRATAEGGKPKWMQCSMRVEANPWLGYKDPIGSKKYNTVDGSEIQYQLI